MDKKEKLRNIAYDNAHNDDKYIEQNYLYKKSILETAGEKFHNIKRAKMDAYMFENYCIEINDTELLAGRFTNQFTLTEEMTEDIKTADIILENTGMMSGATPAYTAHRVVNYEKLLHNGIGAILNEIEGKISEIDYTKGDSIEKHIFYKSMMITLNGVLKYAQRFRIKLEEYAKEEKNVKRKEELLKMAENFKKAPYEPCTGFYEAMQCMWFLQFCLVLVGDISLTGRIDNYLYPYYKKDIEDGKITKEFAFELIENLYYKNNEVYGDWPASIMIGGVDRDANPVWNELSYMCIEAIGTTKLINPSVAVCYTEDMPDDLLYKCIDMIAKGYTRPSIFNDRIIQEGLIRAGVSQRDARYYIHSTCVEITPIASSNIAVATPYVNLTKSLEFILSEKRKPYVIGILKNMGIGCGGDEKEAYLAHDVDFSLDNLNTFFDFFELCKKVMSQIIESHVLGVMELTLQRRLYASSPLASAFLDDCIKCGRDAAAGGAKYNFCYPNFPGVINVIDSLAAIKKAVYDEKLITLRELAQICDKNFEGYDRIYQYILNRCPKFGNNEAEVDKIGTEIFRYIYDELKKYETVLGGKTYPSYFAYIYHGKMGLLTDATPDGRLKGEALSEHLGAVQGRDKNGPVGVMRSISKVD